MVAVLPRDRENLFAHLLADVRMVGEYARHSRRRDAGLPRNLLNFHEKLSWLIHFQYTPESVENKIYFHPVLHE